MRNRRGGVTPPLRCPQTATIYLWYDVIVYAARAGAPFFVVIAPWNRLFRFLVGDGVGACADFD